MRKYHLLFLKTKVLLYLVIFECWKRFEQCHYTSKRRSSIKKLTTYFIIVIAHLALPFFLLEFLFLLSLCYEYGNNNYIFVKIETQKGEHSKYLKLFNKSGDIISFDERRYSLRPHLCVIKFSTKDWKGGGNRHFEFRRKIFYTSRTCLFFRLC